MLRLLVLLLIGLAICGCPSRKSAPTSAVGIYKQTGMESLPAGQQRWLELRQDGTWVLHDMLSGFDGHWEQKGEKLTLKAESGPSGKSTKVETIHGTIKDGEVRLEGFGQPMVFRGE